MKKIGFLAGSTSMLLLPVMALAAVTGGSTFDPNATAFSDSLDNILTFINSFLIPFIIGVGFLAFVWGMFKYFILGGANEDSKESGKQLMIWATLGFVMIIIFWGIVNLFATSTGLSGDDITNLVPYVDPTR